MKYSRLYLNLLLGKDFNIKIDALEQKLEINSDLEFE